MIPNGSPYNWLKQPAGRCACTLRLGRLNGLLAPNRRFAAILADKAYSHCYQERPGGHNWATWEQGLAPGLLYLFDKAEVPISRHF